MKLSKGTTPADFQADILATMKCLQSLDEAQVYSYYVTSEWLSQAFCGLMQLWSIGYVHTELASFSHVAGNRLTITWSDDFEKGIVHYDMYIRNFAKGLSHTNITVGVKKEDGKPFALLDDLEHCEKTAVDSHGFGLLANSIMQCLVLFLHNVGGAGQVTKEFMHLFSMRIISILIAYMRETNEQKRFLGFLEQYCFDDMFLELQNAVHSDRLKVVPFVCLAEKFILACGLLHDRDALTHHIKEKLAK